MSDGNDLGLRRWQSSDELLDLIESDGVGEDEHEVCDLCWQPCDEPGNLHQACAARENAETR